ncbi:MAG: hypothetical protein NZM00_09265, partial [Anaerolinea sp.]|nr:hypothetical protein [Anaerolinea sp.]
HRIGRTARAGAEGSAFSFCAVEERGLLRAVERLIRLTIPVVSDHPYAGGEAVPAAPRSSQGQHSRDAGRSHTARAMQSHTARQTVQQFEERTHKPKRRRSRSRSSRPAGEAIPTPLP